MKAPLLDLHTAGKLGVGAADFSAENLERVKRIRRLVEPVLNSHEAREAAREAHALAEECLQGLRPADADPDSTPDEPG